MLRLAGTTDIRAYYTRDPLLFITDSGWQCAGHTGRMDDNQWYRGRAAGVANGHGLLCYAGIHADVT